MDQHQAFARTSVTRRARLVAGGLPIVLLAACGGGAPAVDAEGWRTLFNGSDLSGWHVVGNANWRVEGRAARADQSTMASFLVSEDSFADFDLELEFWVDTEANSGVFLRCQDRGRITDTSCYEANIFDTRPDQTYRTGSIVHVAEPAEFVYTGGQWNRFEITAHGNRLQVTLNGRRMVDTEDSRFSSGPIALQYAAGTVMFRNVRIRERPTRTSSGIFAPLVDRMPLGLNRLAAGGSSDGTKSATHPASTSHRSPKKWLPSLGLRSPRHGDAVIEVHNSGGTLDDDQLAQVFDRFYRADP